MDDTRVKLNSEECDYINANYVKVCVMVYLWTRFHVCVSVILTAIQEDSVQRKYIMTQGPMGHTCSHFWQMVWEQNCMGIVMLNRCIEKGMVRNITLRWYSQQCTINKSQYIQTGWSAYHTYKLIQGIRHYCVVI